MVIGLLGMVFFYKNKHVQLFLFDERFKTARNMQFKIKSKAYQLKQEVQCTRIFFMKDVQYTCVLLLRIIFLTPGCNQLKKIKTL